MARDRAKPKFTKVNCFLFTVDVDEIKRRAERAGELGWQPRLRKLVHDAVSLHRGGVK